MPATSEQSQFEIGPVEPRPVEKSNSIALAPKLTHEEQMQADARLTEHRITNFFLNPVVAWSILWLPLLVFLSSRYLIRRLSPVAHKAPPTVLAFSVFAFCFLVQANWSLRYPIFPISGPNPDRSLPKPDEMLRTYTESVWATFAYCGALFLLGLMPNLIAHSRRGHFENR